MIGSVPTNYSVSMASTMGVRCLFLLILLILGNKVHPTKTTVPTTTISNNNTVWLEFLPKTALDILDCPALIPCLKSFTVKNIHTDVEVLIASVISNSSNVHVVTFQSSLLLPEDEIMIQILFLPYLEDSVVSSRLVLETSLGLVEYMVMGHSIANPYKVSYATTILILSQSLYCFCLQLSKLNPLLSLARFGQICCYIVYILFTDLFGVRCYRGWVWYTAVLIILFRSIKMMDPKDCLLIFL